jgi:hypothetical protein
MGLKIKAPFLWCSLAYLFAVITHLSLNKYGTTTQCPMFHCLEIYPTDWLLVITTLATSKLITIIVFRNVEIFRKKRKKKKERKKIFFAITSIL